MKPLDTRESMYPPHIHDWRSSARVAWIVSATLIPVVMWSVALYGRKALWVWLASGLSALASQSLVDLATRRWNLGDGSAVLTGLLVACAMPPTVPLYVPALASAFAVLVVKSAFGGLGANWMNPALGGLAFAYLNWPGAMREFVLPRLVSGVDGVSASTPLSFARGLASAGGGRVMETISAAGYPLSKFDSAVTGFLNDAVFGHLGARLPAGYIDLAVGLKPGTLGECALIAVLASSVLLVANRLIKYEIPAAMILVFAALSGIFGTGLPGEGFLAGDALYALSGGGFLLAAFYMASDPVTSPVDGRLAALYGALLGALAYAFRRWGFYTEGVGFAILIMNVALPTLERRAGPLLGRSGGKAGRA